MSGKNVLHRPVTSESQWPVAEWLEPFTGILISDRHGAYGIHPMTKQKDIDSLLPHNWKPVGA